MARPRPAAALAPLLLAAVVAGCRVEVDGAPCVAPGSAADCPDGQACGNDRRCSARAQACAASRCTPDDRRCTGSIAARCSAADPVCGRWEQDDCGARGMECGTQGSAACECPAFAGTTLVADPAGTSLRGQPPFPTGQEDPPECRFGRLGDALAAAADLAPAAATVRLEAGTFAEVTGEGWPLLVASSVAVAGTSPAATGIRGSVGAPAVLAVEGTLEDVRVDADGATTGVRVVGAGARLERVEVSGAAGAALEILVDGDPSVAATVEVLGGAYRASGVGIWIRGGRVSVAPDPSSASTAVAAENPGSTVVEGNAGDGVVVGGHGGRGLPLTSLGVDAELMRLDIRANEGAGLVVAGLPPASRIVVSHCDVRANGSVSPIPYGQSGMRTAAGILVSLSPIAAFKFGGNRVWSNTGDQVAFESSSAWSIAAPSCGPETNVLACVQEPICIDGGSCAVAMAGTGSLDAAYNTWPAGAPRNHATANVANIDAPNYCSSGSGEPPTPSCP